MVINKCLKMNFVIRNTGNIATLLEKHRVTWKRKWKNPHVLLAQGEGGHGGHPKLTQ
jgi:hypothetical protein